MKYFAVAALMLTFPWSSEVADAAAQPKIDEWLVPYPDTRPRDPYVAPDGNVWFCGQAGGYVARFDPEAETFTRFDLGAGVGPHNLIVDDAGMIWIAANTKPFIGRLDPADGEITRFAMPDGIAQDPHTMVFDDAGNIWFTTQRGNHVGRLNRESGEVDVVAAPRPGSRPYGIRMGSDGRPWIALLGTNQLASIDPATMNLDVVELPRSEARIRRLEVATDGAIWYGDYAGGYVGRYDPRTGGFDEWLLPGGESARPYGTALDDDGVLWVAEAGVPNRLVAFDTHSKSVLSVTEVPNARGSIRHMFFDSARNEIWFGEDTNYLARVRFD